MKDIDFDELDRAVSSVLGTDKVGPEEPSATVMAEAPPVLADDTADPVVTAEPAPRRPIVEKRSSGRFMDIMPSSSDMKNQKPAVSRQAATIAPPTQAVTPPVLESAIPAPQPVNPAVEPTTPVNPASDSLSFPDPLDFHKFSLDDDQADTIDDSLQPEGSDVSEPESVQVAGDMGNESYANTEDQDFTLVSADKPFMDGKAIEKRPLGAFSVEEIEPQEMPVLETQETPVTELQEVPITTELQEEPITTELQEEPMVAAIDVEPKAKVESESEITASDVVMPQEVVVQEDPAVNYEAQTVPEPEILPEEMQSDIMAVEAAGVSPAVENQNNITAGSIQPQYTEKTNLVDDDPTPVFDTTQYHQPLKHTPKQKSGWLTVVIITIIILVGIGAGAAVYFFDPFNLL